MIDQLYQKNIGFKKCGVILTCLEPKATHIYDLFTDMNKIESSNKLMDSLDDIQNKFGKRKIGLGASMLPDRNWNMSRNKLSPNYFKWDQLEPYRVCRRVNILRDYPDDKIKIYP